MSTCSRILALATFIATSAALSACGSHTDAITLPVAAESIPDTAPSLTLRWFFDESARLNDAVQAAADEPTRRCMQQAGFEYTASAPQSPFPGAVDPARLFGITDATEAAAYGYAGDPSGSDDLSGPGLDAMGAPADPSEQQRWNQALLGDRNSITITGPDGAVIGTAAAPEGCRGEGLIAALGSTDAVVEYLTAMAVLDDAVRRAHLSTIESDDFAALSAAWSACMASDGFTSATDPYQFAALAWPEPRPTDTERRAAARDVECKTQVDFVNAGLRIELGLLDGLEPTYADALVTVASAARQIGFRPAA